MSYASLENRYLCSELVDLLYEDPSLILNQLVANLEEISSTHATVCVEERLALGSPVSFHSKGHDLHGFVEASEYLAPLGWMVEIRLDSDSQWDVDMFTPDHSVLVSEPIYMMAIEAACSTSS
ncbi:MAG TPA: hypothetical protein VKT81_11060 [Bryobacteraceae bacterium]|nr:hypothetical protein [Bryobacteraceae bacterium]